MIIGVTGNICTGKTTVSKLLHKKGFKYFNDDTCVSNLILMRKVKDKIFKAFPECCIQNELDKDILRNIVFKELSELLKLESILHPILKIERAKFILKNLLSNIVIEVPLLYQINLEYLFDFIIKTECSNDDHISRLQKRGFNLDYLDIIHERRGSVEDNKDYYLINTSVDDVQLKLDSIKLDEINSNKIRVLLLCIKDMFF